MTVQDDVKKLLRPYIEKSKVTPDFFWNKIVLSELRIVVLLTFKDFLHKKLSVFNIADIARHLSFSQNWKIYEVSNLDYDLDWVLSHLIEADCPICMGIKKFKDSERIDRYEKELYEKTLEIITPYYENNKKYLEYRKL